MARQLSLAERFLELRRGMDMQQKTLADELGCSPQFICDVEAGRRIPSVAFIERLCDWLGCGPVGRREWHLASARAHGWKI